MKHENEAKTMDIRHTRKMFYINKVSAYEIKGDKCMLKLKIFCISVAIA